jgi:hypothetical protein
MEPDVPAEPVPPCMSRETHRGAAIAAQAGGSAAPLGGARDHHYIAYSG